MDRAIKYLKFSGDCDNFYEWKENTKEIVKHKGILKYLTKEWEIPTEEDEETDEEKVKIYEGNFKAWNFLIIGLKEAIFGYEVSNENKEILNEVTKRLNNCSIKEKSQDPNIWFNRLFNLILKFKKIKARYEKDRDDQKAHVLMFYLMAKTLWEYSVMSKSWLWY